MDSLRAIDDLYNNLEVFENDVKGSTTSSSSMQNVAFVSENTRNTNDGILLESAKPREIKIVRDEITVNYEIRNGRRSGKQEDSKALVTIDGEGVDWTSHSEEEEDYALMA
ncbi:hypothetical protein Tco_0685600 [Tanacetum coccineum]